ncbi:MAG: hypothetical protein V3S78_08230 [Hyphomicrobium sp.]|jgi:hypothetical protein|nr:hypothetical protein [Hyphomicrobiaceae bacterium]
MPLKNSSPSICVSSEEKVAKLNEFISKDIERRTASKLEAKDGCYLLIARSPDSPVAQSLLALAPQMAAAGIAVRTIFSALKPGQAAFLPGDCRVFRDPRLLAVHEQLVLGPMCAWIGDSMRRDPQKRDSLEYYAAECAQTAELARKSFERIWRAAEPVRINVPLTAALASQLTTIAGANQESRQTLPRQ